VGEAAFVSVSELVGDANSPTRIASYDAAVVRTVILRHVNGHPGLSVPGVSRQGGVEAGSEVVSAEIVAVRSDEKAMGEVMNRLNIEPSVRSVRWQKGPAVDGVA
jgi:hypothetical protein